MVPVYVGNEYLSEFFVVRYQRDDTPHPCRIQTVEYIVKQQYGTLAARLAEQAVLRQFECHQVTFVLTL